MVKEFRYIFGPVPSRRLGISLGISPIPKKTCNYSCIYCQLGRTDRMTNTRVSFFPPEEIIRELEEYISSGQSFDAVTIVGEGEPTLCLDLGTLIKEIQSRTDAPVAVITNGALLYDEKLRKELCGADIVLPSLDAYDEISFRKINRPYGTIRFKNFYEGLKEFSKIYKGQLWIEIMLMKGINDGDVSLSHYRSLLEGLIYSRLYINTPVRPPAEKGVFCVDEERMERASEILHGISIEKLVSTGFKSEVKDDLQAVMSIIRRHPMNRFEILAFLNSRNNRSPEELIMSLEQDPFVESIEYKGIKTYRIR